MVQRLIEASGLPPIVAQLLVSRGVYDQDGAAAFLETKLTNLRDPMSLPGVAKAVERILAAIDTSTPIVVYGDYDADGMTGAAILVNGLRLLGADVSYHVPNRLEEGYGLNREAIEKLAARGKRLIISVDCGIASIQCATRCRELGVSLIVTDHHTIGDELPDADAIVHPRLPGSTYPFGELCGAGVAFKLAWALCQTKCGQKKVTPEMKSFLMQALSLAAIGTVADVVPLLDENRVLVSHGLRMLRRDPPLGLAELMRCAKLDCDAELTTESIAFTIAPRLNAAGRLGQAQLGIELMTIRGEDGVQIPPVESRPRDSGGVSYERAGSLAEYIHGLNATRDKLQRSVQVAAGKQARADFDPEHDAALVLAGVGWHAGVIGVVAGRLADQYAKPVIILSLDSSGKADAVGSGRAGVPGVDLHAALAECEDRLVRYGGHKAAAGLTIRESQIEAFRGDFCEAIARQWTDGDINPMLRIDAESSLAGLTLGTVKQIEMLAPFGEGNPRPVMISRGVYVDGSAKTMGGGGRHLTASLHQGGKPFRAVAFGAGAWCDELNEVDGPIEIVYKPLINRFRGYENVELQLIDWRVQSL
ncbi:MAG: single-stranded-DNA-specific exonuclease RecJ [Planctomycetota bacterium]